MTDDMMSLQSLLEKSTDTDFLREMIGFTAQRLMALEVNGLTVLLPGNARPNASTSGTATVTGYGRRAPVR